MCITDEVHLVFVFDFTAYHVRLEIMLLMMIMNWKGMRGKQGVVIGVSRWRIMMCSVFFVPLSLGLRVFFVFVAVSLVFFFT
jgi:hypothetical protein